MTFGKMCVECCLIDGEPRVEISVPAVLDLGEADWLIGALENAVRCAGELLKAEFEFRHVRPKEEV